MQFIKKVLVTILTLESRIIIAIYKPFVVAVTGSVGKTSTKDAIYSVLKYSAKFARKSEKSMNSEIGLPLTIIGVPNAWKNMYGWFKNILQGLDLILWRAEYPDCLILEIGADHPGDIKSVAKWLHPDIVVMTKVSETPVHVEFFSSPEEVFKEKAYLAQGVKKGGTLVLLADDVKVMSLRDDAVVKKAGAKVISYGVAGGVSGAGGVGGANAADIFGKDLALDYAGDSLDGISFDISIGGAVTHVGVKGVLGNTYMYPLLAATATGKARGMDMDTIVKGLGEYEAPHGRMNIIPGRNGSTIIDDSYNSSPDAAMSALDSLKLVRCTGAGRKIVVLGDMMELGKYASDEHRRVGARVAEVANMLVVVGPRSDMATVEGAVTGGMQKENIHSFDSASEAGEYLVSIVASGDVILVKGSQSMRMERVSAALLREPDRAGELLVRQEKEWLEKK